jgi:hypothetical protein
MPAQSNKPIAPERMRHRFRGKDYLCPVSGNVRRHEYKAFSLNAGQGTINETSS